MSGVRVLSGSENGGSAGFNHTAAATMENRARTTSLVNYQNPLMPSSFLSPLKKQVQGAHKVIECVGQASRDRHSYVLSVQVKRQLRWAIAITIQKDNEMSIRSGWMEESVGARSTAHISYVSC